VELKPPDEDTAVRLATERLNEDFDEVPRGEIEQTVRARLRELCARAQIQTFVPIFAERQARTELAERMANSKR
jgi:hypothetical protein